MTKEKALFVCLRSPSYDYSGLIYKGRIKVMPKLGLQYLKAVLEKVGVDALILDQDVDRFTPKDIIHTAAEKNTRFIGFYTAEGMKEQVVKWIKGIREINSRVPIIAGGPGFFGYKDYLASGANVVCHGEGERVTLEILEYARGKKSLSSIKGISSMCDGNIMTNAPGEAIEDLDSIPFPSRQNMGRYFDYHYFGMKKPFVTMIASRGCSSACEYCFSHIMWGHKIRRRSVQNVLDEIDFLVNKHNVRYICFKDDRFAPDMKWIYDFSEGMQQRQYNLKFACSSSPMDFRMDAAEKISLLKKAGCETVVLGLQSAKGEILENVGRNREDPDLIRSLLEICKKEDMCTIVEFILGLPGETLDSIKENIEYARKNKPNYVQYNLLKLIEGTRLYNREQSGERFCYLSETKIKFLIFLEYLKFYLNPLVFIVNISYVIRNNPGWFLNALDVLSYPFIMILNICRLLFKKV